MIGISKAYHIEKELTVRDHLNELEILDDTYFQKDREKKIKAKYDETLALIESNYSNFGINQSEYLHLKSKAMHFMPETKKEAQEGLEKALELNPENFEALRDLGVVHYYLKDYPKAVEFYNKSLEIKEDRKCLVYLSIAYRVLPTKSDQEKETNLEKGIEVAKKAVNLDISESYSWYMLGNAYMTSFFMTEKYDNLDKSLKAYQQAEKNQKYPNPDLYFNRATIFSYFERYSEAIRDYMTANSIDPGLSAAEKATNLCDFVLSTVRMIDHKKKNKSDKVIDLVKAIPKKVGEVKFLSTKETEETLKYKILPQADMEAGENLGVIYCAKVICQIHKDPPVPACFLCIDSKFNYTVVSLYGVSKNIKDKIKYGDEVLIRDPVLMFISIEYESKLLTYPSIRVITLSDILVNEQTLADVTGKVETVSESTGS